MHIHKDKTGQGGKKEGERETLLPFFWACGDRLPLPVPHLCITQSRVYTFHNVCIQNTSQNKLWSSKGREENSDY